MKIPSRTEFARTLRFYRRHSEGLIPDRNLRAITSACRVYITEVSQIKPFLTALDKAK